MGGRREVSGGGSGGGVCDFERRVFVMHAVFVAVSVVEFYRSIKQLGNYKVTKRNIAARYSCKENDNGKRKVGSDVDGETVKVLI